MREKELNDWKPYLEFPQYGANKNGDICSFNFGKTGKTKKMKLYTDKDGYKYVILKNQGKRHKRFVHRIVLSCFVENEFNKPQVNHINGIRSDNRLENLEWVTAKENCIHSWKNGRKMSKKAIENSRINFSGEKNPKSKINYEIVTEIREDRKNGLLLKEISPKYGLSVAQCSAICLNKFWNNPELLEQEG